MQFRKVLLVYIILIVLTPALTFSINAEENPPHWNSNWEYRKEIILPISTDDPHAIFQPIDVDFKFENTCWAADEEKHSVRVLCWSNKEWTELESQIYDLGYSRPNYISRCGIVFLIPDFADGDERYFVYYDDSEKDKPGYQDHVKVEDAYYYFEPISGISAEGDYYKIIEDGFVVYGIGQKGKVIYRTLSNIVIKLKPETKDFGIINSDNIASFSFSYFEGNEDDDEVSSDHSLVSKEITVDGNLMVEFRLVSESADENLRTSNIYKYYFCPTKNKRISVNVKHQVFDKKTVSGIVNIDGRYGGIISYKSKSEKIPEMRFGDILPYLHISDEEGKIIEYQMNQNPETKNREWIVPYTDDADIGKQAWMSYDEGETGKAHGIIFSSNKDIVKSGVNEQDGLQLKVGEKEYLNALGAEIDYASIGFGRNSYENNGKHDLEIPNDLVIEYDAEFYTTEEGGYADVIKESEFFQALIKYRHQDEGNGQGDPHVNTLTVVPRLTGRFLSHPFLNNITGINISTVYADLYKDGELISSAKTNKPFLGAPTIKFPKLAAGKYEVRVYRRLFDRKPNFIGFEEIEVNSDTKLGIYCTWSKEITISVRDQNGNPVRNLELILYKNESIIAQNTTTDSTDAIFRVPANIFESYVLKAYYKGFQIANEEIGIFKRKVDINFERYDLLVNIKDELGFAPGVNINPCITSTDMVEQIKITPEDIGFGNYLFKDVPKADYTLRISYGSFSDEFAVSIPEDESINIKFKLNFEFLTHIYDSRGSSIDSSDKTMDILRDGKKILDSISIDKKTSLPPGEYTLKVYSKDGFIGIKNIELTNDKDIRIVTEIDSIIPTLVTGLVLVFIGQLVFLFAIKRITLNTFLKLLAMSLIILSLVQPWWTQYATSSNPVAEKSAEMFIVPQAMIETVEYKQLTYLELSTIPEIFTNFLGGLLIIVCSGFFLIGLSFIPNLIYKKRYTAILISASVIFLILVTAAYVFGMSKLTELSLGGLQGEGILDVVLPDKTTAYMNATWGLGTGFYLVLLAAIITLIAGIIDYIRKKNS